ncbi:hypothetical protein BAD_1275 [Bifidobacterium adolescentis ATCC 15703]|uniref:Uncharacterized protein n=1 Tax=Bifidobacterium adolescentis (strain ATCC 15703 / DSM 20083 / NCTC 11814 / E194a) TaxID=367928 RepID=A1A2X3_BIFAA|nr:hypothetical protein BAD_1275 [Bifidobacterium adolescentis ATCC 15703]
MPRRFPSSLNGVFLRDHSPAHYQFKVDSIPAPHYTSDTNHGGYPTPCSITNDGSELIPSASFALAYYMTRYGSLFSDETSSVCAFFIKRQQCLNPH